MVSKKKKLNTEEFCFVVVKFELILVIHVFM